MTIKIIKGYHGANNIKFNIPDDIQAGKYIATTCPL